LALLGFAAIIAAALWLALDPRAQQAIPQIVDRLRSAGAMGMALYAGLYAVAVALGFPLSWSAAAGGFLYGALVGALLSWPAAVVGAAGAFGLGRTLLRPVAARWLARPRWRAVDDAVQAGGARMIALLRVAPVAQNAMSFTLGATGVSLDRYVLGTALGTAPLCALFAWAGSLAGSAGEILAVRARLGPWAYALGAAGAVAGLAAVLWIVRTIRARARL
jgi:uncharacterized membrane protein YdjX (TVP38/TMEM64 family)